MTDNEKSRKDARKELKKQSRILLILALFLLIAVTAGVSYAFFSYTKAGTTENMITTGKITFLYDEKNAIGNGISITNAFPISDSVGKNLTGENQVFNFRILAISSKVSIPYEVTARKKADSDDIDYAVKLYLTEVENNRETETPITVLDDTVKRYSDLAQTSILVTEGTVEKTIYTGTVPANSMDYEKNFRLRMWIAEDANFSPTQDEEGNDVYPMNQKTFSITVNVYSPSTVVTAGE